MIQVTNLLYYIVNLFLMVEIELFGTLSNGDLPICTQTLPSVPLSSSIWVLLVLDFPSSVRVLRVSHSSSQVSQQKKLVGLYWEDIAFEELVILSKPCLLYWAL